MRDVEFQRLAAFRVSLRKFQFFSEQSAQSLGLTSLQYQTLLAIRAHEEADCLTMTALAQLLLIKHNSAVGLVDRIEQLGLATRRQLESDRRHVSVELTARGRRIVNRLATQQRQELQRVASELGQQILQFGSSIAAD